MVMFVLFALCAGTAYWFWIRPILKMRPSLATFYDREASFFEALRLKFAGLKQKLTTAFVTVAGSAVLLHDQIAPLISGIDTTKYAEMVPAWAWPLIPIAITLFVQWLRNLSDKRNDTEAQ